MPDEPESDADAEEGAERPADEEPRPSPTDGARDADDGASATESDADGSEGDEENEIAPDEVELDDPDAGGDGDTDADGDADDTGGADDVDADAAGDDRDADDDAGEKRGDNVIEGTGLDDDVMASYAADLRGDADGDADDDTDGDASGRGETDASDASSHVGDGDDPEPEQLPGYEADDGHGAGGDDDDDEADGGGDVDDSGSITPADADRDPDIDREYDEDELAEEFGEDAVSPPTPTDPDEEVEGFVGDEGATGVTDGSGATPGAGAGDAVAEDEWVEDDWDDDWTDAGIVGEGPDTDEEMPLADHIEEMVKRVGVVLVVGLGVSLAVFGLGEVSVYVPSSIEIVEYLWQVQVPAPLENRPHVYGPLELLLTQLKVAGLTGLIVGLPVFVYETYLFMRPGLYPNERRYYLAAVPTSLVLGLLGVLFAHFVILPNLFEYFTFYTESAAEGNILVAYGLSDTFTLILVMMGYMAVIFQIPLFIMLAIMMGLTTREWMEERRLLFWGAFLGLSFTFVAVDPTGMAPIVIAVTMVVLFEMTLALLRWTGN